MFFLNCHHLKSFILENNQSKEIELKLQILALLLINTFKPQKVIQGRSLLLKLKARNDSLKS